MYACVCFQNLSLSATGGSWGIIYHKNLDLCGFLDWLLTDAPFLLKKEKTWLW